MSRVVVEREIARLDAIGRVRALSAGETIQLDKMIRMERQYNRMKAANAAQRQRPR